jgi:hypothetical protein
MLIPITYLCRPKRHRAVAMFFNAPKFAYAVIALAMIGGLHGCAGNADLAAFRNSEVQLEDARAEASVNCTTREDCDQIWNRARLYVETHSRTPIRRMDDGSIETSVPHAAGIAYFWADRLTNDAGITTIRLKGMCRGMYDADGSPGLTYQVCADQIRQAEADFRRTVGELE